MLDFVIALGLVCIILSGPLCAVWCLAMVVGRDDDGCAVGLVYVLIGSALYAAFTYAISAVFLHQGWLVDSAFVRWTSVLLTASVVSGVGAWVIEKMKNAGAFDPPQRTPTHGRDDLHRSAPSDARRSLRCGRCGDGCDHGARFCSNCGYRLPAA